MELTGCTVIALARLLVIKLSFTLSLFHTEKAIISIRIVNDFYYVYVYSFP